MKDKDKKTTLWEENGIPCLSYCTLPDAAELLKCKVSHLIHLAEVGAIEICLNLNGHVAISSQYGSIVNDKWLSKFGINPRVNYKNKSPLSVFSLAAVPKDFSLPDLNLYGLWAFMPYQTKESPSFYHDLKVNGASSIETSNIIFKETDIPIAPYSDDNPYDTFVAHPKPVTQYHSSVPENMRNGGGSQWIEINVNDVYVTRNQIEKVYSGRGNEMPDHFNGGVLMTQLHDDKVENSKVPHGNVERFARGRESVIMALLYVLEKYPKDCMGKRGSRTNEAWAQATINHWVAISGGAPEPSLDTLKTIISDMKKTPEKRKIAGLPWE
ncbi:hypothetical protein [Enterobacter asburiae]|uniref:hypothetical protein n=1 Tax=Enterobacter asburiae TaxID=61645 RepID=UPI001CBA84B1|nr:hypothetical protein [Enterobacter asburiae]UAN16181.1 hypothetical protein KGP20_23175 [Enterobacter asburiae]